jgi:hydroxyquinol 1,2-dioxygenase
MGEGLSAWVLADGDERLKTIVTRLVRHLHAFAREVDLIESEWE